MISLVPGLVPCVAASLAAAAMFEVYASPGEWIDAGKAALPAAAAIEAVQTVDRSLKGDRLLTINVPSANAQQRTRAPAAPQARETPSAPQVEQKMPVACEPVVSAILRSPLSQRSGRCVT